MRLVLPNRAALIAKEAEVSNGLLFTYFETKVVLLNELYVELKTERDSSLVHDHAFQYRVVTETRAFLSSATA